MGKKQKHGGKPEFEVRIRISKRPGTDHYTGDMEAKSTMALIEALAVLIQKAAGLIGTGPDRVYAAIATILFLEQEAKDAPKADKE